MVTPPVTPTHASACRLRAVAGSALEVVEKKSLFRDAQPCVISNWYNKITIECRQSKYLQGKTNNKAHSFFIIYSDFIS